MKPKISMCKTKLPNAKRRWKIHTFRLDTPEAQAFSKTAQARGLSLQVFFEQMVKKELGNENKEMATT